MDALQLGVRKGAFVIRDVIRHEQTGLLVDPHLGTIYGRRGQPTGWACRDGYVRLGGRHSAYQYAHRIVWEVVYGPIPRGLQIDHLNGRKTDNRIGNLEAVTQSENVRRALAIGLMPSGMDRPEAKLTDSAVLAIRATTGKISNAAWARALGIERSTIRSARIGKSWRHVRMPTARSTSSSRTPRTKGGGN